MIERALGYAAPAAEDLSVAVLLEECIGLSPRKEGLRMVGTAAFDVAQRILRRACCHLRHYLLSDLVVDGLAVLGIAREPAQCLLSNLAQCLRQVGVALFLRALVEHSKRLETYALPRRGM